MDNIQGKYLKDENNNIVSPIVNTKTIFQNNFTYQNNKNFNGENLELNPINITNTNSNVENILTTLSSSLRKCIYTNYRYDISCRFFL